MFVTLLTLGALLLPTITAAHEVYVLPEDVVSKALSRPAFSEWSVITHNVDQFLLWALIGGLTVFIVFFVSISRSLENRLDPLLAKLPPYAPFIGRIAIGCSFLAAAYYGELFGPELPLDTTFGEGAFFVRLTLFLLGSMVIVGYYARVAALCALLLFAWEIVRHGTYMLTYTNYLGELILISVLGAHAVGVHTKHNEHHALPWLKALKKTLAPYAFLILRVSFGISLVYASLYAKVIHNQLALELTRAYPDIVVFFGFEPHFLVLGAAIIEIVIGVFFILGIEIRFASLFLLFWLSLSLWYFGEAVWPHLILIGIPLSLMCYGYDRYSLEGRLFKRDGREPVL